MINDFENYNEIYFPQVYKKEQEDKMRQLLGEPGYVEYFTNRLFQEQMNILRKALGLKPMKISSKKILKRLGYKMKIGNKHGELSC